MSTRFKSLETRLALCNALDEPDTADASFAAETAELNALKNLPTAVVTSDDEAVVASAVSAWAATWLPDTADFSKPNFDSRAVVESTSV